MNADGVFDFLDKHWKPLTFITIVALILAAGVLVYNQYTKGSVMPRDVELTGGKEIIVEGFSYSGDARNIEEQIKGTDIRVLGNSLVVNIDNELDENDVEQQLKDIGVEGEYSKKFIGPSFSETQWKLAQIAIIIAFILMSIVVFILFRTFVPSVGVIFAAITDIVVAMAILSLMDVRLSLPTLAALLMLIGYSVDTDIVLTTEMLKTRGKDVKMRIRTAMKTGLTMTLCALAALFAMYFVSQDPVLQQMATVLIIGLIVDIPATWLTNAGILRWYVNRKERKMVGG